MMQLCNTLCTVDALEDTLLYSGELYHQTVHDLTLRSVIIRQADIMHVDFRRCEFSDTHWQANRLSHLTFEQCQFIGSNGVMPFEADWCVNDCDQVHFKDCTFKGFQWQQLYFDKLHFTNCEFVDCHFNGKGTEVRFTACFGNSLKIANSHIDCIRIENSSILNVECAFVQSQLISCNGSTMDVFEPYGQIERLMLEACQLQILSPGLNIGIIDLGDSAIERLVKERLIVSEIMRDRANIMKEYSF